MLYSHMRQLYTYTCRIHIDAIIKLSEDFFKKIYLILYLKGLCVRGSWRLNKDCNILTSPAPLDIAVCHSHSPGLVNRGPGDPASLGHVLIPASSHQLVWSPNSICRVVAFSTTSCLKLLFSPTHWLPVLIELYNSSIAHSIFGMACLIVIKRK